MWIVPDFSIEKYHHKLLAVHDRIEHEGGFETSASRFLVEAVKIDRADLPAGRRGRTPRRAPPS